MPKVIENAREKLVEQAKKQVLETGYSAMSIRSVAKACGVATGTVYNYFPSKDMLVASFMAEDWMKAVQQMKARTDGVDDPVAVLEAVHSGICQFSRTYENLFRDPDSRASFNSMGPARHPQLVAQLKEIIGPVCSRHSRDGNLNLADFITETLLLWTMQQRPFAEYISIVSLLFV